MFKFSLFRLTGSVPLVKEMFSSVLGYSFQPITAVSRLISDDMLENICEEHGGLLNLFQKHKDVFETRRRDGQIDVRFIPPYQLQRNNNTVQAQRKWEAKRRQYAPEDPAREVHNMLKRIGIKLPLVPYPLVAVAHANGIRFEECLEACAGVPALVSIVTTAPAAPKLAISTLFKVRRKNGMPSAGARKHVAVKQFWSYSSLFESLVIVPSSTLSKLSLETPFSALYVENYDVCRLARCLQTETFTPYNVLEGLSRDLLTISPAEIALHTPERFQIELRPAVGPQGPPQIQRIVNDHVAKQLRPVIKYISAIRYVCNSSLIVTSNKTEKELEEEYERIHQAQTDGSLFYLKAKNKKRHIRVELFWKRNPLGTPFVDDDVLAMLLFDLLQDSNKAKVRLQELRARADAAVGENNFPPIDVRLLRKFPNLFLLTDTQGEYSVARADSSNALVLELTRELTCEETVQLILLAVPRRQLTSGNGIIQSQTLLIQMGKRCRDSCARHFGSLLGFLQAFPETFEVLKDENNVQLICTSEDKLRKLMMDSLERVAKSQKKDDKEVSKERLESLVAC